MTTRDEFKEYVFKYYDGKKIFKGDDIAVVIRGHILIENILEKILSKYLDLNAFDDRDLTFDFKLKMARSIGLLGDLYVPIKRLNKIRNEFAHKIETEIKDVDISVLTKFFEDKRRLNNLEWEAASSNKKFCLGMIIHYMLGRLAGIVDADSQEIK